MKNLIIKQAMCDQYGWSPINVEVDFLCSVTGSTGSDYEFRVIKVDADGKEDMLIKISIDQLPADYDQGE